MNHTAPLAWQLRTTPAAQSRLSTAPRRPALSQVGCGLLRGAYQYGEQLDAKLPAGADLTQLLLGQATIHEGVRCVVNRASVS